MFFLVIISKIQKLAAGVLLCRFMFYTQNIINSSNHLYFAGFNLLIFLPGVRTPTEERPDQPERSQRD